MGFLDRVQESLLQLLRSQNLPKKHAVRELTSFAKTALFHSSDERSKPDKALADETGIGAMLIRENVRVIGG